MARKKTRTIDQLVASLDTRLSELASEIDRLFVLRAELLARKTQAPQPRRHIHAGTPLVVTVSIGNGRVTIREPQQQKLPIVPFSRPMDTADLPDHLLVRN
jgi:hypothetical protein